MNTTEQASKRTALFGNDLTRLKTEWAGLSAASGKDEKSYFRALRKKLDELANGPEGRMRYLPHKILAHLMDGSPNALSQAKEDFLMEWQRGEELRRPTNHYWNSLQFKTGDRWICAAIMAQLLVVWDWLAVAGVWSEEEIDAAAKEALDVVELHLEPHLKGRGHMPLLPDPINQTAACVCGLLYAGYMFGIKWRQEERARRMYAYARNLLADCIGQYPANGYDNDGFTYLRHIHPQVHTLSVALLEEVEGGDWYFRKFAPHCNSLAGLMANMLDFVTPSGYMWPIGRYGYGKDWNLFSLSFAARKTGDARFLQVARRDNDDYSYQSPWLAMDLPLGLLWYPAELDEAISHQMMATTDQKRRVIEDSWAVFTNDKDRMLAVAFWLEGHAPHFFLDVHGSPLVFSGMENWVNANCVQCEPEAWARKSWLNPAGRFLRYCDIPGLQAAYVDSAVTYPPQVGVQRAARVFVNCDAGLVVSDRFSSASKAPPVWQVAVPATPEMKGAVATSRGINNITMRAISAAGDWRFRITPDRKPRFEGGLEPVPLGMLELEGHAGQGSFDVLFDWRQHGPSPTLRRMRDDLLEIGTPDGAMQLLLPDAARPRNVAGYETDAELALSQGNGRLCVAGARTVREGDIERIWASLPVDVTMEEGGYWISGLKYGEFVTLRSKTHYVCVRVGNGIEVWGRSPKPISVRVRHEATSLQLNGRPADVRIEDGWTVIDIPDTASQAEPAAAALAAAVANGGTLGIIRALHDLQQAMAWEYAGEVRALLSWDASTEPTLFPKYPLKTEATYVRLEAAAAAACLGDRQAIPGLIELLRMEAHRDYSPGAAPASDNWWGFPSRSVSLEALMLLHGTEVVGVLDEVLAMDTWPHGIDAVKRARTVFA